MIVSKEWVTPVYEFTIEAYGEADFETGVSPNPGTTDTDSEASVIDVIHLRSAISHFDELASLGAPHPWNR